MNSKFANIAQHFALEPLFVPEEVQHFSQDIIAGPKDLTMKDLGLQATPIDSMLLRISRAYRHPALQSELIDPAPPVQRH